ncbi:DUF1120 domain-containing protein [Pseudomonas sp. XS1P51]
MKMYFAALATTALVCVAPYALAASSVDLTVKGIITPDACTPSLSNGGKIDIGKISAKDLDPVRSTEVGRHPMQLIVACNAPILFALNQIDNKSGTTSASGRFGLGLTSAGEKLGFFFAQIQNTLADAQVAQAIDSEDNGATWEKTNFMGADYLLSVGSTADNSTPIAVKDLTMDLAIFTYIARADSLTLTDEVTMDGSATFEMKYL